jgi:hypothetical protein
MTKILLIFKSKRKRKGRWEIDIESRNPPQGDTLEDAYENWSAEIEEESDKSDESA